ncbi:MAG: hypothetical protein ACUVX8_08285 [Candidatus Zipacnadales bacterium]
MLLRVAVVLFMVSIATSCVASVYWVTSTADAGAGTLRQAITNANTHAGADTVAIHSSLAGQVITPLTPLPVLTDSGTTIEGDVNADGIPDLEIDGGSLGSGNGLGVRRWSSVMSLPYLPPAAWKLSSPFPHLPE